MRDQTVNLQRLVDLIKNRDLLVFAACMVLFHFSNASLLPLVSQNLAHSKDTLGPLFMAGLVIVPQIGVAILAPWIGYWSELWGRKPLLLAGFAAQIARALIFSMVTDPWMMIAVQVLDGITGAAVTVLTILVLTDLTTGTGRFNVAQGILGTLMGIAVALGTGTIGFIVERYGDVTGFLVMAAGTSVAVVLLWALLPETKPAEYLD
jgi:MFS family permease